MFLNYYVILLYFILIFIFFNILLLNVKFHIYFYYLFISCM